MAFSVGDRHPDELYKGGLQRNLFLPFIERLKQETQVSLRSHFSATAEMRRGQHRGKFWWTEKE